MRCCGIALRRIIARRGGAAAARLPAARAALPQATLRAAHGRGGDGMRTFVDAAAAFAFAVVIVLPAAAGLDNDDGTHL